MINLTRIQSCLYVGTYAQNALDIERLRSGPRVSAILNLQTDEDFAALRLNWADLQQQYLARDLAVIRWPIRDFDPEDLRHRLSGAVGALDQLLQVRHRVYVHCTAGVGRAPAVAIAYLSWVKGWELEAAHTFVIQQRACAPYIEAIHRATADRNSASNAVGG